MAVQTPISGSQIFSVFGDQRSIAAKFASVANNDTWTTGLSVITSANVTSGANKAMGLTVVGGTVTFLVTAGPDTNTYADVTGY